MKTIFSAMLSLGCCLMMLASPAHANVILLADQNKIEATSVVIKRIQQEAMAAQKAKLGSSSTASGAGSAALNPQYADALDMSLSRYRAAIPAAIAEIAKAAKADVVVDANAARQLKLSGRDISVEVSKKLDLSLKNLKFIAP